MPEDVLLSRVLAALERAARYRRSLVTDPRVRPLMLQNDITPIPGPPVLRLNRKGWAQIGSVMDAFADSMPLAVWWNPSTDQVKIARPREYVPPSPGPALYASYPNCGYAPKLPFIVRPGHIFTFEGRDYTPGDTERLTAELGSIEGWTWRPDPDAPSRS